jgi:putative two-component system response regulator
MIGNSIIEPLNLEEWRLFARHPKIGATIMEVSTSPILRMAATIALTHHEKWDGSGYPRGLRGEEIPLVGRITAVADVFDALSSKRRYKGSFPAERCLSILEAGRGKHFDPKVLDAFLAIFDEIREIQQQYSDFKTAVVES